MKIWATIGFVLMISLNIFFVATNTPINIGDIVKIFIIIIATFLYTTYGFRRSIKLGVNIYNDFPNSLRLLLSLIGGFLIIPPLSLSKTIIGLTLYACSILLNDEYMRKTYRRIFSHRGFTLVLLGIDGSGKTTYAKLISKLYEEKYHERVKIISFSKYLFVDKFHKENRKLECRDMLRHNDILHYFYWSGNRVRRLIRLLLSLIDNIFLYLITSIKTINGYIIIYDRFMWSTCIKYKALGYPMSNCIEKIWFMLRPHYAIILDINGRVSYKRIMNRKYHIPYTPTMLENERKEYLRIAWKYDYPIINTTQPLSITKKQLLKLVMLIYKYYSS